MLADRASLRHLSPTRSLRSAAFGEQSSSPLPTHGEILGPEKGRLKTHS
jgi:hypothetical protein